METNCSERMKGIEKEEEDVAVIKTGELFRSNIVGGEAVSVLIWFGGTLSFIGALILFTLLFLPFSKSLLVFGLLLVFVFIPIDEHNIRGLCFCRYISRHACSYFPITLHVEDIKAFDPNRAYVFGYEPHSVFPFGMIALAEHTGLIPLPKIKLLASSAVFKVPFLRHIWSWCGVRPVSKQNFTSLLAAGYSCLVIPGGIQETCLMETDNEIAFLNARRGFIRIAMENGAPLVPVFCFGQLRAYKWWKPRGKLFVKFARAMKSPPIIFWGILGSPLPYKHPLHVVIGRPIELKKTLQPTMEEVINVQNQFIAALKDLFERHKIGVGYADLQLKIL